MSKPIPGKNSAYAPPGKGAVSINKASKPMPGKNSAFAHPGKGAVSANEASKPLPSGNSADASSNNIEGVKGSPLMKSEASVFVKRKRTFTLAFLCVFALFGLSAFVTDYSVIGGFESVPKAVAWMAGSLLPDGKSVERLPNILSKLFETALLSVAVTVCAAICAFLISLLGTRTMKANPLLAKAVRAIAAFFRNVPDVVWAILLLFSFGQNILTGFFALFFATFGLLTRTFIETVDEVCSDCVEALHATGATSLQTVLQAIIPSSLPVIVSWVLYMIETNIRNSTLIGMLTATGIGYLFDLYYKRMDYGSAGMVVISIVVLVIAIELISNKIRKAIM